MIFTLKWVSCFCILCQNSFYSFCRSDGNCWFFNNDFESFSFRSNSSGTCFNIFQISSTPLSNTISFCWRVHTYKNKISTFYMTIDEFPEILIFQLRFFPRKGPFYVRILNRKRSCRHQKRKKGSFPSQLWQLHLIQVHKLVTIHYSKRQFDLG